MILITGGAGFIGSHIADALAGEAHEVRVLDLRQGGGDVRDLATVEAALHGVDHVKLHQEHLAAAFSRETGTPVTALCYHNVYGPRMPRDTPYAGVASIFAARWAPAGRRRSSRTAASCATSCTCATSPAPTSSR